MATKKKTITNEEKALMFDKLMGSGIDIVSLLAGKGIKGNREPVDKVLGTFKASDKTAVEIRHWEDDKGRRFVVQTKLIEKEGKMIKTKGFAVLEADFKEYVNKLNSIVDKMQAG